MKDFEKLCGQLRSDTQKVEVEFNEKLMELENIAGEKERAKIMYQRNLDAGREEEMSGCLAGVREQNRRAEKLETELAAFAGAVEEIYARQKKIFDVARASQVSAADGVREAERVLKLAEGRVRFCSGLRESINTLNAEVSEVLRHFKKQQRTAEAEMKVPRDNSRGFWLEDDDPFGQGTLRHLRELKGGGSLALPVELNFKDKEKAAVDEVSLTKKFERSEELKAEFADVKSYLEFKSLIIVQVLELYIVRASGAGDRRRELLAKVALNKCK